MEGVSHQASRWPWSGSVAFGAAKVAVDHADLAGTLGSAAGDGQPDQVIVNATNGNDAINVNGDTGGVKVSGLAATVKILNQEPAGDRLEINTLESRDSVDSAGLAAGAIQLLVDRMLVPEGDLS